MINILNGKTVFCCLNFYAVYFSIISFACIIVAPKQPQLLLGPDCARCCTIIEYKTVLAQSLQSNQTRQVKSERKEVYIFLSTLLIFIWNIRGDMGWQSLIAQDTSSVL